MKRPGLTQETVHGNLGLQKFLDGSMTYSENLSLGNIPGNKWYVDSAKAGDGTSWDKAFSDLDEALAIVGNNDSIQMAPGTYTGNYATEDDTVARNVSIIGVSPGMPGIRGGVNIVHDADDEPVLNINASGWRVSNICFRPGLTSSGIQLTADITTLNYIDGVAGGIAQGVTIDNCMFWGGRTGKYGITFQGSTGVNAPHYPKLINNHFDYMWETDGAAIYNLASGDPIRGAFIYGNTFTNNRSHINTAAAMGWVSSRIEKNSFTDYGGDTNAADGFLHIRATATPDLTGGNIIIGNYFACTKNQYVGFGGENRFITTNGYDVGVGNYCINGMPTSAINHLQ